MESACVIPSGITNALIGPAFGSSYGLIKNRAFAKAQFQSLHMDNQFFEDYFRDTCKIAKADMIAFLKANTSYFLKESIANTAAQVHVLAGEKENRKMLRSVKVIGQHIPDCSERIFPGLYHGEFSINYPERYVNLIKKALGEK